MFILVETKIPSFITLTGPGGWAMYLYPMTFTDFLKPLNAAEFGTAQAPANTYFHLTRKYIDTFPSLDEADIVLLGINEYRNRKGDFLTPGMSSPADSLRREFYKLFRGNYTPRIADIGTIDAGNRFIDTEIALEETVKALLEMKKTVLVFGTHSELLPAHFKAFESTTKALNLCVADAYIDLNESAENESYLTRIIHHTPGFLFNVSHLASQMYLNEPGYVQLMDAMLFDVARLGIIRNNVADAEPFLRNADLVSFHASSVKLTDFPAQLAGSANGLLSEDACALMRFAGLGNQVRSAGIYDYWSDLDNGQQGAKLAAQMLWHFIDGYYHRVNENPLTNENDFIRYQVPLKGSDTDVLVFYKSCLTERWFMEVASNYHTGVFMLPCAYSDYITAGKGDIPDRWLKATQKLM